MFGHHGAPAQFALDARAQRVGRRQFTMHHIHLVGPARPGCAARPAAGRHRRAPRQIAVAPPPRPPPHPGRGCAASWRRPPAPRPPPRVPGAWKPVSTSMLRWPPAYKARWCSTRPPVAMPLAARITMGPWRLASARESSTVLTMVAACAILRTWAAFSRCSPRWCSNRPVVCTAIGLSRNTGRPAGMLPLAFSSAIAYNTSCARPTANTGSTATPPRAASRCSAGPSSDSRSSRGCRRSP